MILYRWHPMFFRNGIRCNHFKLRCLLRRGLRKCEGLRGKKRPCRGHKLGVMYDKIDQARGKE